MVKTPEACGTIFDNDGSSPYDVHGCRLPLHHDGPHEFVDERGVVYQWETDWACTCEICTEVMNGGDGDYCTIYWTKKQKD